MVDALNKEVKAGGEVESNGGVRERISALKNWLEAKLNTNEGGELGKISSFLTEIFEPWKSYLGEGMEKGIYKTATGDYPVLLEVERDRTGKLKITEFGVEGLRETWIWDNGITVDVKHSYGPHIFTEVKFSEKNPNSFYFGLTIKRSLRQANENPPQFPPVVDRIIDAAVTFLEMYGLSHYSTFVKEEVTVITHNRRSEVKRYFEVSNEEWNEGPRMNLTFNYSAQG